MNRKGGNFVPVFIEMMDGMHIVKDDGGRVYGRHKTHKEAMAQMRAVNNAMHREKTGRGFLPGKRKKGKK